MTALQLFNYATATPNTLAKQVEDGIKKANAQLAALSNQQNNANNALSVIHQINDTVYHIERHFSVLSHLNSVLSCPDTRHIYETTLQKLTAFFTQIGQSKPLYDLYKAVDAGFDTLAPEHKTPAQRRAITLALRSFELSGVALAKEEQAKFAHIQDKLSALSSKFSNNVLDATQNFAYPLSPSELSGLTATGLALLKHAGDTYKDKHPNETLPSDYVATLDMPMYLAIMQHADDRALRKRLYLAFGARASDQHSTLFLADKDFDNAPVMSEILTLRGQKATLLGFDNYAALSLDGKMADTPDEVCTFLRQLADKATPYAKDDLRAVANYAKTLGIDELQPWDIAYLSEKLRKKDYDLDSEALRPYFPVDKVLQGLFAITDKLFGVNLKQREVSVWHSDVRYFDVYRKGALVGGVYMDLYARAGKQGGAWLSGYQARHKDHLPVCYVVGNFTPPTDDMPSCLSFEEVTTLFHEFGHALHHLLSEVTVLGVSGIDSVEWDAVELPSQFMENFAYTPEGIAYISEHIDTKEPLPKDKLEAILNAKNFQSGLMTLRQIEFGLFDMAIHTDDITSDEQILTALDKIRQQVALIHPPKTNRFANSFSHIFAGGYASGYYSYKWAQLLSADAFGVFESQGVFDPITGERFASDILAVAGSRPAKDSIEAFLGRPAAPDALYRHSGFDR